jgi:hypothetical protein
VTARLKGVPAIMMAMKANMENPPHEFTDLAFRMAHGSVGFFKDTVATWARERPAETWRSSTSSIKPW